MTDEFKELWKDQMSEEYQLLLAVQAEQPDLAVKEAVALARQRKVASTSEMDVSSGTPTSMESRLADLERFVRHLAEPRFRAAAPDSPSERGEGALSDTVIPKRVIPDGWPIPTIETAMDDYADAVTQCEQARKFANQMVEGWRDLLIKPGSPTQLLMAIQPIVAALVENAGGQLREQTPRVSIDRWIVETAYRVMASSSAEGVAIAEFASWAEHELVRQVEAGDPKASTVYDNLRAAGMV